MFVKKIEKLPDEIEKLLEQSVVEGFNFVRRLVTDFDSGKNRFDQTGEALFGVFQGERLVAIGGVSIDPFESANPSSSDSIGRIRRAYVLPECRGTGVGRLLMEAIEAHANQYFEWLTLFTDTESAGLFYQSLGFNVVMEAKVSHRKRLPQLEKHR